MSLIPVTDSKKGRCMRLKQGLMEWATIFPDSPIETAPHWLKQGARRLHLVDSNGAFIGISRNSPVIKSILVEAVNDIPVQLDGGIRNLATIEKYLDLGLADIIIGTAAVKNSDFAHEAYEEFPGQIIVGLDVKDGMVAINGWTTIMEHRTADLAKQFEENGASATICTDIGRDGIVSGVNIEATIKLTQAAAVPVITSGDLTSLDDIHTLCAVEKHGMAGAITGRAIYEDSIDFAEAQKLMDALSTA